MKMYRTSVAPSMPYKGFAEFSQNISMAYFIVLTQVSIFRNIVDFSGNHINF